MSFVVALIVPIAVGLAVFYALLRRRLSPAEARTQWWRFARAWTPIAVAIIIVAELVWH